MPVQPTKRKTPVKKKTTSKKRTASNRRTKRTKKSNHKKNTITVLAVLLMIGFVMFGYYLGKGTTQADDVLDDHKESLYTTKQLLDDLTKVKVQKSVQVVQYEIPKEDEKPKTNAVEIKPIKKEVIKPVIEQPKALLISRSNKPKLVIIIDDVSQKSQLNTILSTGMRLTPAIFPPSELSMRSHHLASGLKHSMVHLPMESGSKQFNSQYKTLLTDFNQEKIEQRAKELRRLFPHTKYVNNHTGSVFTSDKKAMAALYDALRKEGFVFVDSRTTGSSRVQEIAKSYGDKYVSRDIFIDNKHTVPYIHNQLRKAVNIAKKKGHAIAIGHPHKITMKAIKSAKNIFNGVELVYIDELYREL